MEREKCTICVTFFVVVVCVLFVCLFLVFMGTSCKFFFTPCEFDILNIVFKVTQHQNITTIHFWLHLISPNKYDEC